MRSRDALPILLAVAMLAACTAPAPMPQEATSNIKRIGVVSVAADVFTRQYIGVTVFGNEREEKDVSAWGLDKEYADQVGKAATSVLGAIYVSAPYSYGEFSKVNDLNGPWDAPAFWGPNWTKIQGIAKTYCSLNHLDALLVVTKQNRTQPGSNQPVYPMGIQGRLTWARLLFSARLGLIDCATGALRNSRFVDLGESWPNFQLPQMPIPRELAAQPIPQWDAKTEADMQAKLLALPGAAWEQTLRLLMARPR